MKTFEWIAEHDGYGVVGVSFNCPECGKLNRFVDGSMEPHECSYCHKESMPETDAENWL